MMSSSGDRSTAVAPREWGDGGTSYAGFGGTYEREEREGKKTKKNREDERE
jgi:hypothetical protein